MNTIHIIKVLTKPVKHFQGFCSIDLLTHTLIKPWIIVNYLDKHYMPGSHWVAVCVSDSGYVEYFDLYGLPPTSSKSWHSCNANLLLGHSIATRYRDLLQKSAVTTAASTPSIEPGHIPWRHLWTCLYLLVHLKRKKSSAHVSCSVWKLPRLRPVGAAAAVVQFADINKGKFNLD